MPRRLPEYPTGLGPFDIPYDRSGGQEMTPGMELPQPGGTMKKMSLEFTDPAAAEAAAPQVPQGAGVPPAGATQGVPPTGMTPDPMQGMQQGQQGSMLEGFGQQDQGNSSMYSDEDLMAMAEGPDAYAGQQMSQQSMTDPQVQEQLMMAARRRLGY